MKIRNIRLDSDGLPQTIDVTLTREEAQAIAKWAGGQRPSPVTSAIWDALIGSVFNRFWEDGVDGAIRGDME